MSDLDHSNSSGAIANYDYTYDINNRITEFASPEGVSIYNYDDKLVNIEFAGLG